MSKTGEVRLVTLAVNRDQGFADEQGDVSRFHWTQGVELASNDEIVVDDTYNHTIRVVTPGSVYARLLATESLICRRAGRRRALHPLKGPVTGRVDY